ncbi:MAG: carbon-nitrogen hydrolase family protein [Pseudomonadota bacterium]
MRVAAAQIRSAPGDVPANTEKHRTAVGQAAARGADMIVFPELSLTGYEPALAGELAFEADDSRLAIFQKDSAATGITIGIGVPTQSDDKPRISLVFFAPGTSPVTYAKRYLHDDEVPFFQAGEEQVVLPVEKELLVPAICYEARLPEHMAHACELGATVYLASVAKPADGTDRAHAYFPKAARQHSVAVVMANAVGPSDSFVSAGRSAAWSRNGECLVSANDTDECLLLVDTAAAEATIEPIALAPS